MNSIAKHILIVDDSPDFLALLVQLFESSGYKVSRAVDGLRALETLQTIDTPPALILLDIMMPVMNGIELITQLKSSPKLASIPVIVMTADNNFKSGSMGLPVAGFFLKPIGDVELLVSTVEKLSAVSESRPLPTPTPTC